MSVFDKINISGKRADDETYEEYRERRLLVKKIIKEYRKGTHVKIKPKNENSKKKNLRADTS